MIIIIIVIIINIREQIIQKKMDKKKRYNCYKILNYTKYTKFSIIQNQFSLNQREIPVW